MRDTLRDEVDLMLIEVYMGKDFDPDQPRGPHTGEWIHVGGGIDAGSVSDYFGGVDYGFSGDEILTAQGWEGFDSQTPNKFLREGKPLYAHDQEFVDKMDGLLEKAGPIGKDVEVFRGVPAHAIEGLGNPGELKGKTFSDAGFGATTPLKNEAEKWAAGADVFAENRDRTVWHLTVSANVKGLWMESATGREWGLKELVIQRDARYVVTDVEKVGNQWKITATILPPK